MFATIWKNYKSSIILLSCVIIGGIAGVIFGEQTAIVKPIGDIFLNLMFVTIVPLIFFSISSAVSQSNSMERLGGILKNSIIVFVFTGVVAAVLGYLVFILYNPLAGIDVSSLNQFTSGDANKEQLGIGEMIVQTLTVSDFKLLFDKSSLIPLIIFTLAFGIATASLKEKGKAMADFLQAGSEVIIVIIGYIMKVAPIGLGCYFAYTVGQLGPQILTGYLNAFIGYMIVTVIYFFGIFSLYAFLAGKQAGVRSFWKNATEPSLTAIATSSSAACIPINVISTKKMGVPDDIVETVIPLGASIHKDGSVIGNVLKIIFLLVLTNQEIVGIKPFFLIIGVALLCGLVVGSIPVGGSTSEILMLSIFGLDMNMLGLIMIISTIIDIPATLLNSSGNTVTAMMVARLTEGKNWLKERI